MGLEQTGKREGLLHCAPRWPQTCCASGGFPTLFPCLGLPGLGLRACSSTHSNSYPPLLPLCSKATLNPGHRLHSWRLTIADLLCPENHSISGMGTGKNVKKSFLWEHIAHPAKESCKSLLLRSLTLPWRRRRTVSLRLQSLL